MRGTLDEQQIAQLEKLRGMTNTIVSQAQELAQIAKTKVREGAIDITGIYLGHTIKSYPKKSDPKASVTIYSINVMLTEIDVLAAADSPHYKVNNPMSISLKAMSNQTADLKKKYDAAIEEQKKAQTDDEQKVAKQLVEVAGAAWRESAKTFLERPITNGSIEMVKTLKEDACKGLLPGDIVRLSSATCDYMLSVNKDGTPKLDEAGKRVVYYTINVDSISKIKTGIYPVAAYLTSIDAFQQPVRIAKPNEGKYGTGFIAHAGLYIRTEEEARLGRGPVVMRNLVLNPDLENWSWGKKNVALEDRNLLWSGTVWQEQDDSVPDHPKGPYCIQLQYMEGDWTHQGQVDKSKLLRQSFGINDVKLFGEMMGANPVQAIFLCQMDGQKTNTANPGREWSKHSGNIIANIKWGYFMLNDYLRQNCLRVSSGYVRSKLLQGKQKDAPKEYAEVKFDEDPVKKCLMNVLNKKVNAVTGELELINEKVINVSAFSGKLWDLESQGCEWRVMISVPFDDTQRAALAKLSTADAEKVLERASDAPFQLPEGYKKIVYAVVPFTDEENKVIDDAYAYWKTRKQIIAELADSKHADEKHENDGPEPMDVDDDEMEQAMLAAADQAEAKAVGEKRERPAEPEPTTASVEEDPVEEESEPVVVKKKKKAAPEPESDHEDEEQVDEDEEEPTPKKKKKKTVAESNGKIKPKKKLVKAN